MGARTYFRGGDARDWLACVVEVGLLSGPISPSACAARGCLTTTCRGQGAGDEGRVCQFTSVFDSYDLHNQSSFKLRNG